MISIKELIEEVETGIRYIDLTVLSCRYCRSQHPRKVCDAHYKEIIVQKDKKILLEGAQEYHEEQMNKFTGFVKMPEGFISKVDVKKAGEEIKEAFNLFIKEWTGESYPHLIDSDDNAGQYFRDLVDTKLCISEEAEK